mmetsp:Transcript_24133/g.57064  ORF Transcript_24133/g.57064 Transcript_24133/m.57064 type:complete len:542 (-) Transcript_24133:165-1790(-)
MAPMATANGAANNAATTTGFRYTPPSYLLKTQAAAQPSATRGGCVGNVRMENRPWVGDENGVDEYDLGMMPQEQRPTKNTTNLDAHFQQRVRAKSNRYRTMLKNGSGSGNGGREDGEDVEGYNVDDIHDEHQQAVLRAEMNVSSSEPTSTTARATTTAATVEVPVAPTKVAAAASATQAREARKQRLSGGAGASANSTDPASSSSSSSLRTQKRGSAVGDVVFGGHGIDGGSPKEDVASTARSLRAARLRGSLKPSSDEVDLQSKLEMRRIRSQKEDWQYQQQLQKQQSHSNLQAQRASIEEERRRALEREQRERETREKIEQDRIDAAIEMAHNNRVQSQHIRHIRDASLVAMAKKNKAQRFKASSNGGRRKPSSSSSTSSTDESLDPATKRTAAARTEGKLSRRARLHAIRTGRKTKFPSSSSSSSNVKGASPSATAHDNAFVDDLAGMLRDSGILSSCVACFGDEDTLDYNKNDSSSSGIVATSPDGSMKLRQRAGYGGGFEDDHVFGNGSSSDDSSAEAAARDVQRQKMDLYAKYRE